MDTFTMIIVIFSAGIIYLGARLFKKIQFIKSLPDEETHSQRSDVQRMLKQQLEKTEEPPEKPEKNKSTDGKTNQ